jgi:hypothetical protein
MRTVFRWLFYALIAVAGLGAIGKLTGTTPGTISAAAPAKVAETPPKGDPECLKRWLKAEKSGITYGEGMVDGHMEVMVDEATFRSINYQTKVGLASTFQCAVVGNSHELTDVRFVSNMTGKVLATWSLNKLTVE